MSKVPDTYRFTPQDVDRAWDTFANRYDESSDEEIDIMNCAMLAEEIFEKLNVWPTLAEVSAYSQAQEDDYWQRHFGCDAPR